ncbi:MAG: ribosome small subunit-dependent GTPase A [Clostridia bacterium]|nr:ribosome small subunit-dependent GTPase A [Clostridia bacterium]
MNEPKGRIIRSTGGLYTVDTGSELIACRAKGAFRHDGQKPLAGDIVTLRGNKGEYAVSEIRERKNSLIRPPLANLDYLFVVVAAASPDPILLTVDKLISIAEFNSIEPVVVVTKEDLDSTAANEIAEIYIKCGFTVFVTSPEAGSGQVLDFIKQNCADSLIAFAGNSGVGKSTLMNALFPTLSLETGDVSQKTERGRHTTRAVELYALSGLLGIEDATGYAADTPGFSMLDFVRFDFYRKEDLPGTFREFDRYIGHCRYTKCSHTVEDGCAILEALESGEIPKSRHESFLSLYADLKDKKDWM